MVTEMERECKEESAIQGIVGTLARDQFPRTVGSLHGPHDTHRHEVVRRASTNWHLMSTVAYTFYACKSVLAPEGRARDLKFLRR